MTVLSRRDFALALLAGVPLAAVARPVRLSASSRTFGVATSSFRDLPRVTGRDNVDEVIRALQAVRATHVALALSNVEPAPPSTAAVMGGSAAYPKRIVLTPEQIAATNADARASLRAWRIGTSPALFEQVRGKLTAAGMTLDACAVSYDDACTDEEIEAIFRQARILGAPAVSARLTMAGATRLAPFAERHKIPVAIHNEVDGNRAGAIDTARLTQALALSPALMLTLDIGNLTASNCDAVAELRAHRARVSAVVVKDRLRNGGVSQPFGEGDTPIRAVLEALGASPAIPVLVDYDYVGLRSPLEEVRASLAYLAQHAL